MSDHDDLIGRIDFQLAKFSGPGWLMPNTVELLRDCKTRIGEQQTKLSECQDALQRANVTADLAIKHRDEAEYLLDSLLQCPRGSGLAAGHCRDS